MGTAKIRPVVEVSCNCWPHAVNPGALKPIATTLAAMDSPELGRRLLHEFLKHLAQVDAAIEPGRVGDVGNRQVGLDEEPLRALDATRCSS